MWNVLYLHTPPSQQRTRVEDGYSRESDGNGKDLYQNDRDIEMWFSLNYGRLY